MDLQKQNNKGFVLMETLIVSVFVMALFTIAYTSIFPLVGQYERREFYDDIDSKYTAHWVRKLVMDYGRWKEALDTAIINFNVVDISDCSSTYLTDTTYCNRLKSKFNITKMFVTSYSLSKQCIACSTTSKPSTRSLLMNRTGISNEFKNYIDYLPNYDQDPDKLGYYRVIVEIDHEGKYKSYGTIEVMR